MKTVPILFTFDSSLELAAGVCFTSLLESADPSTFYDIFVLHGPECDYSGSRLNELPQRYGNCHLTFRRVEGEFVGGYEVRGIPETAYYRLLSPELIPEYDKLLYSDVDVIIREDLGRFYDVDLGENYFAGVDNCSRLRPSFRKYITDKVGLDWQKGYFYSGNLVINSARLLADGLLEKFRSLGEERLPVSGYGHNQYILQRPHLPSRALILYDRPALRPDSPAAKGNGGTLWRPGD